MPASLEDVYRAYLAALNARRFDELDRFVHDELTYNGAAWTRPQYAARLAADVAAIPDLHYEVRALVVAGDQVAARLWFDCTPSGTFLGVEVDGGRAAFAEHVFYRFEDGRIREVWSLIDTDAVRAQVGRG